MIGRVRADCIVPDHMGTEDGSLRQIMHEISISKYCGTIRIQEKSRSRIVLRPTQASLRCTHFLLETFDVSNRKA